MGPPCKSRRPATTPLSSNPLGEWGVYSCRIVRAPPYNNLVASFSTRLRSTTRSERWSLANAVAVLLAVPTVLWLRHPGPLLFVGLAMLGAFVVAERAHWTPEGSFGAANVVTTLRIGLLILLPPAASVHPAALIALSLLILVLDGLDGWLARRRTLASEFGAFFDKETDALFLLLLCGLAAFQGTLSAWILGAGLLRYGFVLLLFLLPTPQKTESRSTAARYVYGFMVGALLASFLPFPRLSHPLVAVATTMLLASFARSLWQIIASRQALGES